MAAQMDMKILVVDDMLIMRKLIKKMLNEMGFTNVADTTDGALAWPLIQDAHKEGAPYQFVISDWNMPEMNGLDLFKNIRSTPGLENLPFLMITAETDESNIQTAVNAGLNNFIHKPFAAPALKEKIDKIFE